MKSDVFDCPWGREKQLLSVSMFFTLSCNQEFSQMKILMKFLSNNIYESLAQTFGPSFLLAPLKNVPSIGANA